MKSLVCTVLMGSWLVAVSAAAHGLPPRAMSPLLAAGSGELQLVQLTRGLALRSGAGFRYFCPMHWDGNENAPAAFFPRGPALLSLATGLVMISADGVTTPYAETDLGVIVGLANAGETLYALALRGERYELRRIEPQHTRLLWSAAQTESDWSAIAASAQTVALLGLTGSTLTLLQLSPDGVELNRQRTNVPGDTLAAQLQVADDTLYVNLQSEAGDRTELGGVVAGEWRSLVQASASIAGPIDTDAGHRLISVDGSLQKLDADRASTLGENEYVTGLWQFAGVSYASVRAGLRVLEDDVLGPSMFDFASLQGPDAAGAAAADASACESSWQHLQVDLVAAGVNATTSGVASGSAAPVDETAAMSGGASTPTAGSAAPASAAPSSGCSSVHDASSSSTRMTPLPLLLSLARRRRRRRLAP